MRATRGHSSGSSLTFEPACGGLPGRPVWQSDLEMARRSRLRLCTETPDPAAGASHSRHVTIAKAERLITNLVTDGTVTLADLGVLQT